jgi:NitT/TauT family transport system permease protein
MILWFGLGLLSKIAIVFLGALFPIALSTATGVRTIDLVLIESARSFAATDWQIIRTVVIPGALPSIVTGLRLGANRALVGVIVGELVSSTAGVGRMMATAGATFQTDKVFVGVITLAVFGYGLSALFRSLEHYFSQWRAQVVLPDER